MLSTATLPLIDLTLRIEFQTLRHLDPSLVTPSDEKAMHPDEALAMYPLPGLRRKGRLYYPNPQIEICP